MAVRGLEKKNGVKRNGSCRTGDGQEGETAEKGCHNIPAPIGIVRQTRSGKVLCKLRMLRRALGRIQSRLDEQTLEFMMG